MRQSRLFNVLRRKNFGFKIDFFPPSLSLSLSVSLASLQYLCLNCLSRSLTHTLSLSVSMEQQKSQKCFCCRHYHISFLVCLIEMLIRPENVENSFLQQSWKSKSKIDRLLNSFEAEKLKHY